MDLLSTVRKQGSRGGVNFSWDEVANSNHRENYLGHSLKAPVGRWQKGKDLTWYAKGAAEADGPEGETDAERQERIRKEELRKIKEAEEDAMAAAMGLPPPVRDASGANAVEVGGQREVGPATKTAEEAGESSKSGDPERRRRRDSDRRERRRHRSRSRSRERRPHRRDRDRSRDRDGRDDRRSRRDRSRSAEDRVRRRRDRDRSREPSRRHRSRSREHRRRSRSPRDRR